MSDTRSNTPDQGALPTRRTQPARHGRLRRHGLTRTIITTTAIGLAVVLVSTVSVAAIAVTNLARQVNDNAIDLGDGAIVPTDPAEPGVSAVSGGFNVLVVGTDNDANQGEDFGERDATLNDVNIVLHVAPDHKSATVLSLPRDLIVDQPECTNTDTGVTDSASYDVSLNTAYERGGLACVNSTVEQLTGLDISFAGVVSFNGVIAMSNAVGGVPICLAGPIRDTDSGLDLPAGTSVVSGQTALAFLRTRHGVGDGSDLARISSQQQYMSSLMRTMTSNETLGDVTKLYGLASATAQNVRLSTTLTDLDTMVSLGLALKDIDLSRMLFVQYPGSTEDPDFPGKVVPDTELAAELLDRIRTDTPFTLAADGQIAEEPVDGGAETGAEDPATTDPAAPDPAAPTTPDATGATPTPTPTAIAGVSGQTAAEETCAVPSE